MLSGIPLVVFLARDKTISVIGAESLGTAVIDALVKRGHKKIIATRRNQEKLSDLKQRYQIEVSVDNTYAVKNSQVVVLGVKPYLLDEVCEEIKYFTQDKLVISLAAAKSLTGIEKILSTSRVCRVMTGISVHGEVAAYTLSRNRIREDEDVVKYIFGDSALKVQEDALADRTWIACDTGLIAKSIEHKINSLDRLSSKDARIMYAATLETIAKSLRAGMTGNQIYGAVAGPGSFTEKLHHFLIKNKAYDLIGECVKKTVTACRK